MFMGKFGRRPMHFFGAVGTFIIGIGILILLYLSIGKFFFTSEGLANRPLFYLGILLVIVGMQLFMTGFIAELITRNSTERNDYKVVKRI
jgi:hypothetical protein